MVSAILFGRFADFGKTLTIIQRSSQPVYSQKWEAPSVLACLNKPKMRLGIDRTQIATYQGSSSL